MSHDRQLTRLLLVRHAETVWNVERRYQGQGDSPLTERGHRQAARLADRLAALPVAAIYTSDLGRTVETARALAAPHGLSPRLAPALREASFGEYEGFTFAELVERFGDAVTHWAADPVRLAPPGGETLIDFQARVGDWLPGVVADHPGETVLLVGHGGSVRAAVMDTLGMDLAHYRRLRMDNAALTIVDRDGDFKALVLFNDTSHLGEA